MTGNAAALSRLAALEASRAAISASIRVRSTSSGVQRWVLAVSSTSGAVRRTAASLSRRNPASRSAGSCGTGLGCNGFGTRCGGHEVAPVAGRDLVGVQGSGRRDGQVQHQRVAGRAGLGVPVPAARMERTSAARNRLNATARRNAATSASWPWAAPRPSRISNSEPSRVLPIAAAPTRNASASSPSAQNCCSTVGFRPRPATGRWPGPVVVLVEDRRLARGDRVRVRPRSPRWPVPRSAPRRGRRPRPRWRRSAGWAPSSGPRRYRTQDSRSTLRVTDGAPISQAQRRQRRQQLPLGDQPLVGNRGRSPNAPRR